MCLGDFGFIRFRMPEENEEPTWAREVSRGYFLLGVPCTEVHGGLFGGHGQPEDKEDSSFYGWGQKGGGGSCTEGRQGVQGTAQQEKWGLTLS